MTAVKCVSVIVPNIARLARCAMMRAAALVMAILTCTGLAAQERMVFEVASVRPNNSGPAAGQSLNEQGDTLVVTNLTVRDLISRAYQIQGFQIVGGPEWIPN